MFYIRKFNTIEEKVSRSEKEEVLNDSNIRVGVEFEIESNASVFEEGSSDNDYDERFDDMVLDFLQNGDWDDYLPKEEFIERVLEATHKYDEDWVVIQDLDEQYSNAFEKMGYTNTKIDRILSLIEKKFDIQIYDFSEQMSLFPENHKLKESWKCDLSTDVFPLERIKSFISPFLQVYVGGDLGDEDLYAIKLRNGGVVSFEIDGKQDVILLEEYTNWNNMNGLPIVDVKTLSKDIDLDSLEEIYDDEKMEIARDLVAQEINFNGPDTEAGGEEIISALESIIGTSLDVIDDYHSGSADWRVESDSSLSSDGAFELITPNGGLPLDELLPIMKEIFNYIEKNEHLYTSNSTGLHVNMSIKGVDFEEDLDPLKLALFMEEGKVFKYFESRKNNSYTMSVLNKLRDPGQDVFDFSGGKKKEYSSIIHDMNSIVIPKSKYWGINLSKIESGLNYVEFRYLGGKNYHANFDIVKRQILDYGFFLKVATQRDFKWKEYILKLNRLYNSIEKKVGEDSIKTNIAKETYAILQYHYKEPNIIGDTFIDFLDNYIIEKGKKPEDFSGALENYIGGYLQAYFARNLTNTDALFNDIGIVLKIFRNEKAWKKWRDIGRVWNEKMEAVLKRFNLYDEFKDSLSELYL